MEEGAAMKVLFAIDGSAGSFEALGQVGPLLTPGRDEVMLYCSPPQVKLASSNVSAELVPAARAALADAIFQQAAKRLTPQWESTVTRIVGTADARRGILAAAEQTHAELIVVGARGLNRFERLFLGSVSRAVVHGARVPVWIARPRPATSAAAQQILLCCENSTTARCPVELLSKLSWPGGTNCSVLTVISSVFAGHIPVWLEQQARSPDVDEMVRHWVHQHEEEVRDNFNELRNCLKDFPGQFAHARPQVVEGEPAERILAEIASQHADLVVIGARHGRSTAATIFGSTAEAVLNHAGCSVLVVPHPETP
jgi:nucleotide-binding universal stress UspA family protein